MNQSEQTLFEINTGKKSVRRMPTISEIMEAENVDNFLGGKKGKKRKIVKIENKTVKTAQKVEKKEVKTDSRRALNENKRSKAKSRILLAEKGIIQTNTGGEILTGGKALLSGLTGTKQIAQQTGIQPEEQPEEIAQATHTKPQQTTRPKIEAGVQTNIEERTAPTENVTAAEKTEPKKDNTILLIAAAVAIFLMFKK